MKLKQSPMEKYFSSATDISVEGEVEHVYTELKDTFGFVPRFYKILASTPNLAEGYWEPYEKIMLSGHLSREIKEMIFLAIAVHKNCAYCSSIHLAVCDKLEVNPELLQTLISDIDSIPDQNLRELITFTIKCVDQPDIITTDDFVNIENLNFAKDEILEAISVANYSVSCINMAKTMMISVDNEIKEYLEEKSIGSGLLILK